MRTHGTSWRRGLPALAALLASCTAGGDEPHLRRPNFLLISIDSLRADHLSAYGYERETSPRIDHLAGEGVLFTNTISSTSWTLPAHASMFTGLPASVHGCNSRAPILAPERQTVAESLREVGYQTAGFFSGPYLHPTFGLDQGFDEYKNCASFAFYEGAKRRGGQQEANRRSHGDVTSPKLVEEFGAWLRQAGEEPFFVFVHMWDVHYDYIPPAPYDTLFDPDYDGEMDGTNIRDVGRGIAKRDLEHLIALYDGEIVWTDKHVGMILDLLDEVGKRDDTAVLLTADHGEEFLEHGKFGHRKALFEESIAVPLIVRYPARFGGGRVVDAVAGVADIAPTLLELAGAAPLPDLMGRSLVPLLESGERPGGLAVSELVLKKEPITRVIRTRDWKVRLNADTGHVNGFWDLTVDPGERENQVRLGQELAPDVLRTLEGATTLIEHLSARHRLDGPTESGPMPPEIEQMLKDLGYIGEDE